MMHGRTLAILMAFTGGCLAACDGESANPADVDLDSGVPASAVMDGGGETPDGCTYVVGFPDEDGDGHGAIGAAQQLCAPLPEGYAATGEDCNDDDENVSPDATESCNLRDDDCDEAVDEGLAETPVYIDGDGDGFGAEDGRTAACDEALEGFVPRRGDCDDDDENINPDAAEVCNAIDDDCDVLVDEGLVEPTGDPILIAPSEAGPKQVDVEAWLGGYVAVWTSPSEQVMWTILGPTGAVEGEPAAVAADTSAAQTAPKVALVETETDRSIVVVWREDDERVRARSIDVDEATPIADPVTLSGSESAPRLPVEPAVSGQRVIVPWMEVGDPGEIRAGAVDALTGEALETDVPLLETSRLDVTAFGPSAVVLPSDPATMYLGLADTVGDDTRRVGYVHEVQVRPTIAITERSRRLPVPEGFAARRVMLAPGAEGTEVLAFVSRGMAPDERTDGYLVTTDGLLTPTPFEGTLDGLVVDGVAGLGGSEVITSDVNPLGGRELLLRRLATTGHTDRAGMVDRRLDAWASLARRTAYEGLVVYTGLVSDSDVEPGVWTRRYGCEPVGE